MALDVSKARIEINAVDNTRTAFDAVTNRMRQTQEAAFKLERALQFGGIGLGVGAFAAVALKAIDSYTKFTAQLQNSTKSSADFAAAQQNVIDIAKKAQTDIGAIGGTYARLSNALRDVGATTQQVSGVVETLALGLKANGATAEETSSVMLQLSQSFGKGKLDGDEFRSAMEAAPNVMRALAKSIGVPFGALKDLSQQGQITSEVMLKAFTDPQLIKSLNDQAEKTKTISGAWQVFSNELEIVIGKINQTTGASKILIATLEKAATLLSVFEGGEKGSILRNFLDTGVAARQKQFDALSIGELKKQAMFYGDAKIALEKRLAQVSQSGIGGLTPNYSIAPNFSASIGAQNVDDIHRAQQEQDRLQKQRNTEAERIQKEHNRELLQAVKEEVDQETLLTEEAGRAHAEAMKERKKAIDDVLGSMDSYTQSLQNQQQSIQDNVDLLRLGAQGFDELQLQRMKDALATSEQITAQAQLNGATEEAVSYAQAYTEKLREQLEIRQKISDTKLIEKSFQAEKDKIDKEQKAQEEAIKQTAEEVKRMSQDINRSITDALMRGFEGGKGFAKNFMDTLKNMFKTLILRPTVEFLLRPISGALAGIGSTLFSTGASAAGVGGSSGGAGGIGGLLSNISGLFSQGNGFITGAIEKLGIAIAGDGSGIGGSIGGFLGQHAAAIGSAASYLGAAVQLLKGNVAGAALTGIGTFLGGPIGGAIGGLVGSFFGHKKTAGDARFGLFDNGAYSNTRVAYEGGGSIGAGGALDSLNATFSQSLAAVLKTFGVNDAIYTASGVKSNKKGNFGYFSTTINGQQFGDGVTGPVNYGGADAFQEIVKKAFGPIFVQALQASSLGANIKKYFNGLTDQAAVTAAVNSLLSLKTALGDMPAVFNSIRQALDSTTDTTSITQLQKNFDAIQSYTQLFYSQQEQFDTFTKQITTQFGLLNEQLPTTRDGFRKLVDGLDTTTAAGLNEFNALVALAPSMDQYYKSIQAQTDALKQNLATQDSFASVVDYRNYLGVANNYGGAFAADFVGNSDLGNITWGANGKAKTAANEDIVSLLSELRDLAKYNNRVNRDAQNNLQRIDILGVGTRAA